MDYTEGDKIIIRVPGLMGEFQARVVGFAPDRQPIVQAELYPELHSVGTRILKPKQYSIVSLGE